MNLRKIFKLEKHKSTNCDTQWRIWQVYVGAEQIEGWTVGKWNYAFPAASEIFVTCLYKDDAQKVADMLNQLERMYQNIKSA